MLHGSNVIIFAALLIHFHGIGASGYNQTAACNNCTSLKLRIKIIEDNNNLQTSNVTSIRVTVTGKHRCSSLCSSIIVEVRYKSSDNYPFVVNTSNSSAEESMWSTWIYKKKLRNTSRAGAFNVKFRIRNVSRDKYYIYQASDIQTKKTIESPVQYFGPKEPLQIVLPVHIYVRYVAANESLSIPCVANGKPDPILRWLIPVSAHSESLKAITNNGSVLQINRFTPNLAGVYVCIAENYQDSVTRSIQLISEVVPSTTTGCLTTMCNDSTKTKIMVNPPTASTAASESSFARVGTWDPSLLGLISLIVVVVIPPVLLIVILLAYVPCKKKKAVSLPPVCKLPSFPCAGNLNPNYYKICPKSWGEVKSIPTSKLNVTCDCLGEGEFGQVVCGWMSDYPTVGRHTKVAVKLLKDSVTHGQQAARDLYLEAEAMSQMDHPNILKFFGVHGESTQLKIVSELLEDNLLSYLKKNAPTDNESTICQHKIKTLTDICIQVSSGMEYLCTKRLLHCDLAARNCLIKTVDTHEEIIVKISDFGKSRHLKDGADCYVLGDIERMQTFPVKWMSPEALYKFTFSHFSDVWSFGVLMWEVYSYGKEPYEDLSSRDIFELKLFKDKPCIPNYLQCPAVCPNEVYQIMCSCWQGRTENRPLFCDIKNSLHNFKNLHFNSDKPTFFVTSV